MLDEKPTPNILAEIAANLTSAQRCIILGQMVEIPPEEAQQLIDLGLKLPEREEQVLVTRRWWPITVAGLEVRELLIGGAEA